MNGQWVTRGQAAQINIHPSFCWWLPQSDLVWFWTKELNIFKWSLVAQWMNTFHQQTPFIVFHLPSTRPAGSLRIIITRIVICHWVVMSSVVLVRYYHRRTDHVQGLHLLWTSRTRAPFNISCHCLVHFFCSYSIKITTMHPEEPIHSIGEVRQADRV